ncbi:MAG: hypothetical protein MJ070_03795 [Lachnospiraceae bacterium]|nr:hypothetical protein [Lachnospiraceae bacterium]
MKRSLQQPHTERTVSQTSSTRLSAPPTNKKSRKLNSEAKVQFFGALSNIDFDIFIRQTNAVVNSKLQKIGERSSIYIKDGHAEEGKKKGGTMGRDYPENERATP